MNHLTKSFISMLSVAVAIVGCNRAVVDVNPNFDPEKDEVNAAFVMSVSTGASRNTKMSAQSVQKEENFLGITDAKVILYEDGRDNAILQIFIVGFGYIVADVFVLLFILL